MPRFYINFRNRDEKSKHNVLAKDDEGIDVADLEEARKAALISAREIVADNVKSGATLLLVTVVITDDSGQAVRTPPEKAARPAPRSHWVGVGAPPPASPAAKQKLELAF